jgi:Fur family ferric uptake transcriptional regulator
VTARGERRGAYQTRQRRAVLRALAHVREFISAQELYARLRHTGDAVGLTTVYRSLQALADAGYIESTRAPAGERLFRYCPDPGCVYFLVCYRCGEHVPLDAHLVEDWAAVVAQQHGFSDIDLTVEITGLCSACAPPAKNARDIPGS